MLEISQKLIITIKVITMSEISLYSIHKSNFTFFSFTSLCMVFSEHCMQLILDARALVIIGSFAALLLLLPVSHAYSIRFTDPRDTIDTNIPTDSSDRLWRTEEAVIDQLQEVWNRLQSKKYGIPQSSAVITKRKPMEARGISSQGNLAINLHDKKLRP